MTNCPNCGAPITGPKCEYCGTRFPEYRKSSECWAETVNGDRIIFNGVSSGILTPNEAREMMGFKLLEERRKLLDLELAKAKSEFEMKRLYREAIDVMRMYRE